MYLELDPLWVIVFVNTGILGFMAYNTYRQKLVDSANLTVNYIDKIVKENRQVITIIYKRERDKSVKFESHRDVRVLLNGLEDIVIFTNEKTLDKKHVLNKLRILLRTMKKDDQIKAIIKAAQKKDKKTFESIEKFMNDLD